MKNNDNDKSSLLAHLAGRFKGHNENIATEALRYILREQCMRDALADFIKQGGVDIGDIKRARTEVTGDKKERVDLVGFDEAGNERALIEAKFWAGLTENQPNEYLNRLLKQDTPSVLLFVCPDKRIETLWNELRRLTNKKLSDETNTGDIRVSKIGDTPHRLMLTSWRALLKYLKSRANKAAECDIDQLNALCEQEDSDAFLPLRRCELGPEISRRVLSINNLVDDVIARLVARKVANTKGLSTSAGSEFIGRYVFVGADLDAENAQAKGWCAWLGIHFSWWAKHRETPLWISFVDNKGQTDLNKVRKRLQHDEDFCQDRVAIPIYLPVGVEYDAVIEAVVNRISEIADKLGDPQAD